MRLYDGTCVADEHGVMECCCRFCVQCRVLQADEFVEADKMRRAMWPGACFEVNSNVCVDLCEDTMPSLEVRHVG